MNKREIMKDLRRRMAPQLAENAMKEQEALMGYYRLQNNLYDWCDEFANRGDSKYSQVRRKFAEDFIKPLIDIIEEHISDELNHANNLQKAMIEFGMVKPAKD